VSVSVITGDCRDVLPTLPAQHFHTCVTSPPYFGLRDYGTAEWEGGDAGCDHKQGIGASAKSGLNGSLAHKSGDVFIPYRDTCGKCGARRIDRQIGLEPTPDEFVGELVKVFREVKRVLRDDGTVWVNLGDSYGATGGNTYSGFNERYSGTGGAGSKQDATLNGMDSHTTKTGLRPKNLLGIPWRVAFALQADGWYLRQDIIWSKPNPMPESVTDRCTKAHEYIFLLSKSPRYWFDAKAIAEPLAEASISRLAQDVDGQRGSDRVPGKTNGAMKAVSGTYSEDSGRNDGGRHPSGGYVTGDGMRNRRSVWTVATQPFSQAHFATFPPALIEPCILAGCPVGGQVLDPFGGAGTTGLVADRLQRHATLIELNPAYAKIAHDRMIDDGGMFTEVAAE